MIKHDGSNIKKALCHNNSFDSSLILSQGYNETQFLGFEPNKSSFLTYTWQHSIDRRQLGDGKITRKPYQ